MLKVLYEIPDASMSSDTHEYCDHSAHEKHMMEHQMKNREHMGHHKH